MSAEIAPRLPSPTRAARHRSGSESREHSTTLPSAVTSSTDSTWLEMLPEPLARAVRGGRDRAGDGLHVDVAEVLEGEALGGELLAQVADHDAALDARQPRRAVDVEHAVHPVQPDHGAVGAGDVGERVARMRSRAPRDRRRRRARSPPAARPPMPGARPPRARIAGHRSSCATCGRSLVGTRVCRLSRDDWNNRHRGRRTYQSRDGGKRKGAGMAQATTRRTSSSRSSSRKKGSSARSTARRTSRNARSAPTARRSAASNGRKRTTGSRSAGSRQSLRTE